MRICLVNSVYAPVAIGGAEKSVQLLAEALTSLGHSILVIVTGPSNDSRLVNNVPVNQIKIANLYWPFASDASFGLAAKAIWHFIDCVNPIMGSRIEQIISEFRPDIVHTNNVAGFSVGVWAAVKRLGYPLIHTLRDYYLLCPRATMFRHGRNCDPRCAGCTLLTWPRKYFGHYVDHVVSISQSVLEIHRKNGYFYENDSTVIYNPHDGINVDRFEGQFPGKLLRIGFMGRLAPSKGLEILFDAISRLAGTDGAFELIVAGAGDPEYVARLKWLARQLPVVFVGHVSANQFYGKVDVVVVPSLWREPLGRVALEACVRGVPVIAARDGGLSEIVKDGETGWLYDAVNVDELLGILRSVLSNVESLPRMRDACIEWAASFTPVAIARQYLNVYQHVQTRINPRDGSPTADAAQFNSV